MSNLIELIAVITLAVACLVAGYVIGQYSVYRRLRTPRRFR